MLTTIAITIWAALTLFTAVNLNRLQKIVDIFNVNQNKVNEYQSKINDNQNKIDSLLRGRIEKLEEMEKIRQEIGTDEIVAACTACYKKDKLN